MELNDSNVQELFKKTYTFALYKLGNMQQAEDVASQTINKFILKSDMVNSEKAESWLRTTCLNNCRKYFREVNREHKVINQVQQELIGLYDVEHSDNSELMENFRKAISNLNELEARSLVLYFNSGQNVKKMAEIIGENYGSLRKRIFRIKQKLKAETYKELGYIATKKIVIPQMHEAIIQFVKRLKKNVEQNTIEKMFYYFSEVKLKDYNPQFDINTIKDYEIVLRKGKYTIYLFYSDSTSKLCNLYFTFYLNEKNQLKITKLPQVPKKMVTFAPNSAAANKMIKYLKDHPESNKGLIKISDDIINEIAAKN